jgi:hypothetical protein
MMRYNVLRLPQRVPLSTLPTTHVPRSYAFSSPSRGIWQSEKHKISRRSAFHNSKVASMSTTVESGSVLRNKEHAQEPVTHYVAIALGSNMGDRISYIEQALHEMRVRGLCILSVSKLYQTKAMYYEDQESFINGACYVRAPPT